jgi:cytochrome P450
MPKTGFYQVAVSYGAEPMFAMMQEEPHRRRKKMVGRPYLKTSLMADGAWQVLQSRLAEELRSSLGYLAGLGAEEVELYDLFFAWSVTSTSAFIFGEGGSLNLLHDLDGARRVRERYSAQRDRQIWVSLLPFPESWLRWMGLSRDQRWIWEMQDRAERHQNLGTAGEGQPTVYAYMKEALLRETAPQGGKTQDLSRRERSSISAEMQDHVIAAIDTSTATLATCAWLLSLEQNRKWQDRLREEVASFSSSEVRAPDVDQLPILNAIIKETLRLYPPAAGSQPRVTTKTTVLGPKGHEVTVPPNVAVHAQAWTLHRNGEVFEDPEGWRPERWLDRGQDQGRREMDAWFWAFGSGSRKCLGENLAMSSLGVALTAIWSQFETRATENTKITLSSGILALPIPNDDGQFIRICVDKLDN